MHKARRILILLLIILLSGLIIIYLWNKNDTKDPVAKEYVKGDTLKIFVPGKRDTIKTIKRIQNKSVLRPLRSDKGNLIYTDTLKKNDFSIAAIITRPDSGDEIILDIDAGSVSFQTIQTDTIKYTITDTLKFYMLKKEERKYYDNYLAGFLTAVSAGVILYLLWE